MTILWNTVIKPSVFLDKVSINTAGIIAVPTSQQSILGLEELYVPKQQEIQFGFLSNNLEYKYSSICYVLKDLYTVYSININAKNYPILIEVNSTKPSKLYRDTKFYLNTEMIMKLCQLNLIKSSFYNIRGDDVAESDLTFADGGITRANLTIERLSMDLVRLDPFCLFEDIYCTFDKEYNITKTGLLFLDRKLRPNKINRNFDSRKNCYVNYSNSTKIINKYNEDVKNGKPIILLSEVSDKLSYILKLFFIINVVDFSVEISGKIQDQRLINSRWVYEFNNLTCNAKDDYLQIANDISHTLNLILTELNVKEERFYITMSSKFELIIGFDDRCICIPLLIYGMMSFPFSFYTK